jgi:fructose-1,6-bisphosphatase I
LFRCPCRLLTQSGDRLLCHALQFSFKSIAYYIRRATLVNLTGLAGSSNITGDEQKKLDVISNDLFIEAMRSSGKCALLVSEEEDNVIYFKDSTQARYAVACDPIDGSSNLDAGVSVGTIFAIHKLADGSTGTQEDILKPGTELLAAGFTMYGASSQLVITMKGGTVNGFTLDTGVGEFILTHPDMRIPRKRAIYSVNEGNSLYWQEPVKQYFNALKEAPEGTKPYSSRYIGSMVADAYRTLLYGGIFAYPADKKSPKGKLRILYECAPMAMVFENGMFCLLLFSSAFFFFFSLSLLPASFFVPPICVLSVSFFLSLFFFLFFLLFSFSPSLFSLPLPF